ncbi:MAG: hypothetical protein AABW72_06240, partial [archaeon]
MPAPKRPHKRFFPVYIAFMASELKKGTRRGAIAKRLVQKGANPDSSNTFLSRKFPKEEIAKMMEEGKTREQAIDALLWKYRQTVKSSVEWNEIARKREAGKTPEERSEIGREAWAGKTPAERSEIARGRNVEKAKRGKAIAQIMARKTPEERSEIARKGWAGKTPEERSEIARRKWVGKTPEERSEIARKGWVGKTPEERSEIGREAWAGK